MRSAFAISVVAIAITAATASVVRSADNICPDFPPTTLDIDLRVPEDPSLDGRRQWQFSVCKPARYSGCPSTAASYIIEINATGNGCDAGFGTSEFNGHWLQKYGGLQTDFLTTSGDRTANMTLICDPNATTPVADGPVVAHSTNPGSKENSWIYNIRVKAASVCLSPPPPGPKCPDMPLVTLPIDLRVPEEPSLDGRRLWQFSVCKTENSTGCASNGYAYIFEINANGDGCDAAFRTDEGFGFWEHKDGGLNNVFTGAVLHAGDRIANTTLICDPHATTPVADGPVVAHSLKGSPHPVWTFDIRVKAASVCPPA